MTSDEISWAPSRRVFVRRVMLSAGITFIALLSVALIFSVNFGLPRAWGFSVALTLTVGFMVDDVMRWRNARTDRWLIHDGHLIHDGNDGRAQIPLSDVVDVWTQYGSRVIVKLASGQRVAIRYLPFPDATAAQIKAARAPSPPAPTE